MSDIPDAPLGLALKLLLVGDVGVGKTSLLQRFASGLFPAPSGSGSGSGADFCSRSLDVAGERVTAQVWDVSGQGLRSVAAAFYRDAAGALLVYDITDRGSFESLDGWHRELRRRCDANLVVLCVGSKADLEEERQVSSDELLQFAEERRLASLEASAKSGANVHEAFRRVLQEVHSLMCPSGPSADTLKAESFALQPPRHRLTCCA